ncbi:hypothetical protein FA13DRAFT_271561 [Coprinellus micaceus]|uniref:Uncharacterized protein n=1 Tax=Coprinellus micaceus TaxID=71717 RepID=A0A4Y7SEA5_COPMI|nr:hypothetical protein FA13DRAFT_271561 [Coprinellus micaceus]
MDSVSARCLQGGFNIFVVLLFNDLCPYSFQGGFLELIWHHVLGDSPELEDRG